MTTDLAGYLLRDHYIHSYREIFRLLKSFESGVALLVSWKEIGHTHASDRRSFLLAAKASSLNPESAFSFTFRCSKFATSTVALRFFSNVFFTKEGLIGFSCPVIANRARLCISCSCTAYDCMRVNAVSWRVVFANDCSFTARSAIPKWLIFSAQK